MKHITITLILGCCSLLATGQIHSFETTVPQECSVSAGVMQISSQKYKLGKSSLQWNWQSGGYLKFNKPNGLNEASTASNGGIYLWIYNPTPLSTPITLSFANNSGKEKCVIVFNLNFKGWRLLLARFANDMQHDRTALSFFTIKAPTRGGGTLYFDFLEFQPSVTWERISDSQYSVATSDGLEDFNAAFAQKESTKKGSIEQLNGLQTITNRVDNWLLWNENNYTKNTAYTARKKAVSDWINRAVRNYPTLNLTRNNDGTIGGDGLFPDYNATASDGTTLKRFRDISDSFLIPFAIDYRLNNNTDNRDKVLTILDWYTNQGWASGSAMGSLRFEKLRSSGYFHSLFMMRNALGTDRLERELEALRWYSLYGQAIPTSTRNGETADNIRTLLYAKLYFALMQPDKDKAVTSLLSLQRYLNSGFDTAEGYLGTFKPDGSGYHHLGTYFGAYYPDALYVASLVYYWLHDTPFALDSEIGVLLKKHLLIFTETAARYDLPMATCGRFATNTTNLQELLPALGYLALAMKNDTELIARLKWLWQPGEPALDNYIASAKTGISHHTSLGEIGLTLQAMDNNTPAETIPSKGFFLPYSGLLVHRTQERHVAIKGFSKYIWDFESSSSENLYGRYLSYGQIEHTHLKTGRKNNAYGHENWNWGRIPGTTTKQLSLSALSNTEGGNGRHRNFSDESFLGGIAPNNQTAVFGFKLHDNTFDKSFIANKSVFISGEEILCLGSQIGCTASSTPVVTTLFQHTMENGEQLLINNSAMSRNQTNLKNPCILDNQNTGFVVIDGLVNIESANGLVSGYIAHGNAPRNKTYGYYMLPNTTAQTLSRYTDSTTAPFVIERQDATAHIVTRREDGARGFVIFDHTSALNRTDVVGVNTPSMIWLQPSQKGYTVTVTDPDMRRPTATTMDKLTESQQEEAGDSFPFTLEMNGKYSTTEKNIEVTTTKDNTSLIRWVVSKGKSYTFSIVHESLSTENTHQEIGMFSCRYNWAQQAWVIRSEYAEPYTMILHSDEGREIKRESNIYQETVLPVNAIGRGTYLVTLVDTKHSYTQKICLPD